MAEQLIGSLEADWDPTKYADTYREQVLELIERKAAGEESVVVAPEAPSAEKVVDLMEALEASVTDAKKARKRHPTGNDDAESESSGQKSA
jgi:DNA end-binding protein Ku